MELERPHLLPIHRQSPEGRRRKLRTWANVGLLCIDEVGYLSFDDKAADLLYEVVNCRYERKPLIVTTNRPFKEWNEVFPNATCIVTLLDRLLASRRRHPGRRRQLSRPRKRTGIGRAKEKEMTSSHQPSEAAYGAAVLTLYLNLPDTPLRPSPVDQSLTRKLFADAVALPLIESALLLGTLRRLSRV